MAGTGIGVDGGSRNVKVLQGRDKGGQFQVLTLGLVKRSLDKDGVAKDDIGDAIQEAISVAAPKKARYLEELGRPDAASSWHFLTGDAAAIQAVTVIDFKRSAHGRIASNGRTPGRRRGYRTAMQSAQTRRRRDR